MKTSERIFEAGWSVGFWPLEVADKLPRGIVRFFGYLFALLLGIPCVLMSFPFIVAGTLAEIWEKANR